jgi:hypothetical protein
MTVANMSGVILVTCDDKQHIIKESRSLKGFTSAYIVDKQRSEGDTPDVIINIDASREDIREDTQMVVNMDSVQKVRYRIV